MKTPLAEEEEAQDRTLWNADQRLSVLKLYLSPNGASLDENNNEVNQLANEQHRQPSSIALKLRNFRYLDSGAEVTGLKGMSGFSKRDVICWKRHSGRPLSSRAVKTIQEKGWNDLLNTESGERIPETPISRALLSKPFLILTGPSGTGKTRGAIQLAKELHCEADCLAVVAVGADWTDNRHVVGFLNPLQTADGQPNGIPIYETTAILNLLLHANEHPEQPHVLILDEMNLSHVERYFADFLSAMELEDKEKALKLHSAGSAKTREGVEVKGCIDFPENLFVIGTVNIDETTYMFSPKVLDRANVIEIHAEDTALEAFLKGTAAAGAVEERNNGISFLDLAQEIRRKEPDAARVPLLPDALKNAAADRLMELFRIMKRGRGEFGFRTGREVLAYLRTAHFLTPEADRAAWAAPEGKWLEALDAQILQKILPKLHGSRTRLAPLLGALATYCATGMEAYALEHFPEGGNSPRRGLNDARNIENPKFPNSYRKLERMIGVLVEEQFVSFIC